MTTLCTRVLYWSQLFWKRVLSCVCCHGPRVRSFDVCGVFFPFYFKNIIRVMATLKVAITTQSLSRTAILTFHIDYIGEMFSRSWIRTPGPIDQKLKRSTNMPNNGGELNAARSGLLQIKEIVTP